MGLCGDGRGPRAACHGARQQDPGSPEGKPCLTSAHAGGRWSLGSYGSGDRHFGGDYFSVGYFGGGYFSVGYFEPPFSAVWTEV